MTHSEVCPVLIHYEHFIESAQTGPVVPSVLATTVPVHIKPYAGLSSSSRNVDAWGCSTARAHRPSYASDLHQRRRRLHVHAFRRAESGLQQG
jgi:hypothetical protein